MIKLDDLNGFKCMHNIGGTRQLLSVMAPKETSWPKKRKKRIKRLRPQPQSYPFQVFPSLLLFVTVNSILENKRFHSDSFSFFGYFCFSCFFEKNTTYFSHIPRHPRRPQQFDCHAQSLILLFFWPPRPTRSSVHTVLGVCCLDLLLLLLLLFN